MHNVGRFLLRETLAASMVAVVVVLLGVPIGLLWRLVSPTVELVRGTNGWYPVEESPEGFVADDGWFSLIGLAAGVVVALVAWHALRRWRGPVMLIALAAGSLGAAFVASWVGHRIGLSEYERQVAQATVGTHIHRLTNIRDDVVLLSQTLATVTTYTLLAAFHYSPSLRNDHMMDIVVEEEPAPPPTFASSDREAA